MGRTVEDVDMVIEMGEEDNMKMTGGINTNEGIPIEMTGDGRMIGDERVIDDMVVIDYMMAIDDMMEIEMIGEEAMVPEIEEIKKY